MVQNLLLEGVRAQALQGILDKQLQNELLPAFARLLSLVLWEHDWVELDKHLRHLHFQMSLERINSILGLE